MVDALGRAGAPVPAVVAIDPGTRAVGRPCFVMEWVEGRSVPDAWPNAYHDGWFLDAGADAQRATWDSFHDALAAVHRVELDALATAYDGPRGALDVLALLARGAARGRRRVRSCRGTSRCSTGCSRQRPAVGRRAPGVVHG